MISAGAMALRRSGMFQEVLCHRVCHRRPTKDCMPDSPAGVTRRTSRPSPSAGGEARAAITEQIHPRDVAVHLNGWRRADWSFRCRFGAALSAPRYPDEGICVTSGEGEYRSATALCNQPAGPVPAPGALAGCLG